MNWKVGDLGFVTHDDDLMLIGKVFRVIYVSSNVCLSAKFLTLDRKTSLSPSYNSKFVQLPPAVRILYGIN